MDNWNALGPVTSQLFHVLKDKMLLLIPVFLILTACYGVITGKQGEISGAVRRVIIAVVLLFTYPQITNLISTIFYEFAMMIDNMEGWDDWSSLLSKQLDQYKKDGFKLGILELLNDIPIAIVSWLGYWLAALAKPLVMGVYHFVWLLFISTGPFFIALSVLPGGRGYLVSHFKGLCEVAAWPIAWSLLSVLLKTVYLQNNHYVQGGSIALLIVSILIFVSLICTPFIMRYLVSGSFNAMAPMAYGAILSAPAAVTKAATLIKSTTAATKPAISAVSNKIQGVFQNRQHEKYLNMKGSTQDYKLPNESYSTKIERLLAKGHPVSKKGEKSE